MKRDIRSIKNEPILVTKLQIPRILSETVSRPRLTERLNLGLQAKLTYINAPAGFGKSTLLSEWANSLDKPAAWVSLDMSDNHLNRFWRYIVSAMDFVAPGLKEKTHFALHVLNPDNFETVISILLNELTLLNHPLVLIIDDFHFAEEPSIVTSFSYFIEYLPEHVHVYVTSRKEPPFPTSRLQSRRHMIQVDAQDLRFDSKEGEQFYSHCMRLDVQQNVTDELVRRTEGWITAMKLAALSLRDLDHPEAFLRQFSGDFRLMEQYLMEEVFHLQSESLQNFLLKCAILKRMNGSLCKAVTGDSDSRQKLEFLEHSQLFTIPLDEKREWYRFHHLFEEFLWGRLQKTNPKIVSSLYMVAGEWCQDHGFQDESLDYYLAGKHYESVVGLLEAMTTKMIRIDWMSLLSRLAEIPIHYLLKRPSLYFSYLLSLLFGSKQYSLVDRMLQDAESWFDDASEEWTDEEKHHFLGSLYFVKTFYTSEVLQDIQLSIKYMSLSKHYNPSGTKLVFAQQKSLTVPNLSKDHKWPGRKQMTREALFPFLNNLVEMVDDLGLAGTARISLSEMLYEWNDLDEAENYAKKAIDSVDASSPQTAEYIVPAWLSLFRTQKALGMRKEAESVLQKGKSRIIELGIPVTFLYFDGELARLALEDGNTKPAEEWLRMYRLSNDDKISLHQLYEYLLVVRILMARQQYREAWGFSQKLLTIAKKENRTYYAIEIYVLQGLLLQQTGKTEQALQILKQALLMTESEQFIRIYVDEDKPMERLLTLFLQSLPQQPEEGTPSRDYVQSLLNCFKNETIENKTKEENLSLSTVPYTGLTKREQTVLRLLIKGLSNKEIAEQLNISYGTVKTHIINIYGKLNVNSRVMAVRRGMELGL